MPLYRVTTYKEWVGEPFAGEKWSNVYYVQTGNAPGAATTGVFFADTEMAVSYEPVVARRVVAVNVANHDDRAVLTPNTPGALDPTGMGGFLPLFNTVRVVLTDAEGRPESKFLRTGATPAQIGAGSWDGAYVTFVETNYAAPLIGELELRGPNDESITGATVQAAIQNRQLGWHRRTRPGFVRGWVPVG